MNAFVAGATGYTGREVVRELNARGITAFAHVRPDSRQLDEWRNRFRGVAEMDTTPWELQAMTETFTRLRPAFVFGLLGTTRSRARAANKQGANDSYQTVDYGLTALLLDALQRPGHTAKFIYLSSMGVSARSKNPYIAARWRMESELRASGMPYVIARPALITGSDREEFRMLERGMGIVSDALLDAAGAIGLRGVRDRFHSLTGQELARGMVAAALDPSQTNVVLDAFALRKLAGRA
jgi:uncharacterized protein YbjT (DUF2867 family)